MPGTFQGILQAGQQSGDRPGEQEDWLSDELLWRGLRMGSVHLACGNGQKAQLASKHGMS